MRRTLEECRLYGIVDTGYVPEEGLAACARELCEGGVRVLQLRAKGWTTEQLVSAAPPVQEVCRAAGALFVMNDDPTAAAELGADAVHVGQDAGPLAEIRRIVGERMLIGRSTHSVSQALAARDEGADYIGFGPLFPTPTKPGRPAVWLQDIATVEREVGKSIPVFCIGGITSVTLPSVLAAGARRVVIVSHLLCATDRAGLARELLQRIPLL